MDKRFRDPLLIETLVKDINEYSSSLKIMEVCGSHTMSIGRWGIRKMIPKSIQLVSGPGCPVCVTPASLIDQLLEIDNITLAIFGDLMRVPGKNGSLEQARARGKDIRIVYSPLDALEIAREKETIFVGIGFETTIPGIAHSIIKAQQLKLSNFSVYPAGKLIPPALEFLLSQKDTILEGFILPGHVSVIIGEEAYDFLVKKFAIGGVITGFEPLDILISIKKLLDQKQKKQPLIDNEYKRVVSHKGNESAKKAIYRVFQPETSLWRGLGEIPDSGLGIKPEFSQFDARLKYSFPELENNEHPGCRCSDVLKGVISPPECKLFKKVCTPKNPLGSCMVSSEGSCAAYYKYEG